MRLSFHQRILLILICLGAIPTAAAIVGWGLTIRTATPGAGPREALEEVGATGRALLRALDTTDLSPGERDALAAHAATLNSAIGRFQRVETYDRYYYAGLGHRGVPAWRGGAVRVGAARRPPVASTEPSDRGAHRMDRTHPPDGAAPARPAAPRSARSSRRSARRSGRWRPRSTEAGREAIEAERLRAFRETARRVAHEMKNPLTPIRLAVAQLSRSPSPSTRDAIDVLIAESERLEHLAREFTEFGRLPEGPAAPVDLCELLEELARSSVPPTMTAKLTLDPATPVLQGHYDPLRRAFANIIRNAVEASGGEGELEIAAAADAGGARVTIRDHGPGIPPELEGRIFDPYFTGKQGGTGLGLALAKQTVELHEGTIAVEPTVGGGATFVVRLSGL